MDTELWFGFKSLLGADVAKALPVLQTACNLGAVHVWEVTDLTLCLGWRDFRPLFGFKYI